MIKKISRTNYLCFVSSFRFWVVSSYVFQLIYSCASFLKVTVATDLILSLCSYLDHSYISSEAMFLEVCGRRETLDMVFTRWPHPSSSISSFQACFRLWAPPCIIVYSFFVYSCFVVFYISCVCVRGFCTPVHLLLYVTDYDKIAHLVIIIV